jgi:membrane-associated phospholipid phosphatase
MKTSYFQARPFWAKPEITPYGGCSTQFGNPSGHSIFSMASCLAVWLDYNYCCNTRKIPETSVWSQPWMRHLALLFAFLYGWTVAYSRIVLGMHSYNQIFYGLMIGIWLALSFHFIFYEIIFRHVTNLCQNKVFART